jgi:hypothetical protein
MGFSGMQDSTPGIGEVFKGVTYNIYCAPFNFQRKM